MTFKTGKDQRVSLFIKSICGFLIFFVSHVAFAEYYVVYSTVEYATPPPIVYYHTSCHVVKHVVKHKKSYCHQPVKKKHKKSHAIVSVYTVAHPCGSCVSSCNSGCRQVLMPTCQGCGYRVFYGTPVWHSDSYYMQGLDENDPVIDGNTYDNDIY